jgi:hypothetical protein
MLLAWWILLCVMSNDSLAGPKKPHLQLHICGAIFLGLVLCTSQLEPELQYLFLTMVVSLCLFWFSGHFSFSCQTEETGG